MEFAQEPDEVLILIRSFPCQDDGLSMCRALEARAIRAALHDHAPKPRPFDVYVATHDAVRAFAALRALEQAETAAH